MSLKNRLKAFFMPQAQDSPSTACYGSGFYQPGTALPKGGGLKSLRALFPDLELGEEIPGVPTMYFGSWKGPKRGQKC